MRVIDCGGGLGVDYDGTRTDAPASLAYTTQVPSFSYSLSPLETRAETLAASPCWHIFLQLENGRHLARETSQLGAAPAPAAS